VQIERNRDAPAGTTLLELAVRAGTQLRDKFAYFFGRIPDKTICATTCYWLQNRSVSRVCHLEYSGLLVTNMSKGYRVETAGSEFAVIDPWGVRVGTYASEEAAKQDIERCVKEDAMYESAKKLVDAAMTAHSEMFGISRETASYWIRSAAETVE
jgi:hypothetical protein